MKTSNIEGSRCSYRAIFSALRPTLISLIVITVAVTVVVRAQEGEDLQFSTQRQIADVVRDRVLEGRFGERTLWMTERPLDQSYVARDSVANEGSELAFPFDASWLVMIDDSPDANFGHPVRWVFVDARTGEVTAPVERDFPPVVLSEGGLGVRLSFKCSPMTPKKCPELVGPTVYEDPPHLVPPVMVEDPCLYAVLVSGGISESQNFYRYRQNLSSVYKTLRSRGYLASNIFVYYADGRSTDLDNEDGDAEDATGSDITGPAEEEPIRARIQKLCSQLNVDEDVLFTYFSNHGANDNGVCLWDVDGNGLQGGELYSPAELASDTADCQVCRHFMIHDQCYSGDFLPMTNDGDHGNLAIYTAASGTEPSVGRQYMAQWEQNDASTTTISDMHQDVVDNGNLTSTPGTEEGAAGVGDFVLGACCRVLLKWYWYVIPVLLVMVPIWLVFRRRAGGDDVQEARTF